MTEFLAMSGYGTYVWSAYAIFLLVLAADMLAPLVQRRRVISQLRNRIAREHARRSRSTPKP